MTEYLQAKTADPKEILEVLLQDNISPAGGDTDQWIRENHLRFLLRPPTAEELSAARTKINAGADGWREVILTLTLQIGYQSY